MKRLLDHALAHGVDWECGGIYRDGIADGEALIKEKEFWQNAEVLVGFLDGFETFGNERYFEAFENIWGFVNTHMINHEVGEFRTLLTREGKPIDPNIGNPWKVAYHTGRSMLECYQRLARIMDPGGRSTPSKVQNNSRAADLKIGCVSALREAHVSTQLSTKQKQLDENFTKLS